MYCAGVVCPLGFALLLLIAVQPRRDHTAPLSLRHAPHHVYSCSLCVSTALAEGTAGAALVASCRPHHTAHAEEEKGDDGARGRRRPLDLDDEELAPAHHDAHSHALNASQG